MKTEVKSRVDALYWIYKNRPLWKEGNEKYVEEYEKTKYELMEKFNITEKERKDFHRAMASWETMPHYQQLINRHLNPLYWKRWE